MLSLTAKPILRSTSLRCLVGAVILFLGVSQFALSSERWQIVQRRPKITTTNNSQDPLCSNLAGSEGIVITVKTGATEAAEKVPVQLRTSLQCVPVENILWFSDMNQDIGVHRLHDALDAIDFSVTDGNPDFDIYRKQQELKDPVLITSQLRNMRDPSDPQNLASWELDKYKNIHIVEKSWALKPDMEWYFNIDADTYLVWPSLLSWLPRLDPTNKSFTGARTYDNDQAFAHGGSGLLLSKAASHDLVVVHNGTAARWDAQIDKIRYGDSLLARALQEYGIPVTNCFPMCHGETPSTLWFHPGVWCMPIVTLHHMSTAESEQMRAFEESRRDQNAPLLYSELFKGMVFDMIPDHDLEDWDNRSEGTTLSEIVSAEDCSLACDKQSNCMQSLYKEKTCILGKPEEIVYGRKHEVPGGNGEEKWRSSWNKTRIADWVSRQSNCEMLTWPKP